MVVDDIAHKDFVFGTILGKLRHLPRCELVFFFDAIHKLFNEYPTSCKDAQNYIDHGKYCEQIALQKCDIIEIPFVEDVDWKHEV